MSRRKPRPAVAEIVGGDIVIRLPVRNIPAAVEGHVVGRMCDTPIRVTDAKAFAKHVVYALNDETEDGATPVHRLFDAAFWKAAEDGAEGADVGEYDDRGEPRFGGAS